MPSYVPAPSGRLIVRRGGRQINRLVPKPVVIVDTREQNPFTFAGFTNWIGGVVARALPAGDYSVEGMESLLALERKSLSDLVGSVISGRERFLRECERLAGLPYKAILIEATYEEVNSPYHQYTTAHPNAISGACDAIEARWDIPILYTSSDRDLAERKAASWLSKAFTYWWLETNGYGRVLQEGDL
jgi:ERCC4-type nuclease